MGTTWIGTGALRWLVWDWGEKEDATNTAGQVLQQAWRSDAGQLEWRDIEVVKWADRDK